MVKQPVELQKYVCKILFCRHRLGKNLLLMGAHHACQSIHWLIFEFLYFWHILCIHCLNIYKFSRYDFITWNGKYHSVVKPVKCHKGSIVILNDRHEHLMTWIWLAFDDMMVWLWSYCLAKIPAIWGIVS